MSYRIHHFRFGFLLGLLLLGQPALSAPAVVASILPLHSLAASVMDGVGEPHLLLRGTDSPHTFSLRPSDARRLNQADLILWIGPALEAPLSRVLPNVGDARQVALMDAPGLGLLEMPDPGHAEPSHAGHQPHAGPHHSEDERLDPHIWLSPINAIAMAREISRQLSELDPANAAIYQANTERLTARLMTLDEYLARQLGGLDANYAVFHNAFRYLEQRYKLQASGVVTVHPERSPGAAHLRQLRQDLQDREVRCLFSEPQFPSRLLAALSDDLPIRHAVLDPLGSKLTAGPAAYEQIMHAIGDTLSHCLQGAP